MRNYLAIITLFLVTLTQAQIMLPAYQAIQYKRNTLPTVITSNICSISPITAGCSSIVSNDGGTTVTVRGICWSNTTGPTIALVTKTTDGSGIGSFLSSITGLTVGITYYVRAYATNNVGTAYGNELTFTTTAPPPLVTIGTQVWSTKNLDVTTYRDGTPIPQVTDITTWANLTTGAWCYYNNDPANGPIYGKLYNKYAVAGIYDTASLNNPSLRKQIAPIGFHVPTDSEWNTLLTFLGGGGFQTANKLKPCAYWLFPEYNTNSSGFTALGAGKLSYFAGFLGSLNNSAHFWTSTNPSTFISISPEQGNVPLGAIFFIDWTGRAEMSTEYILNAVSVRCIKN